MALTRRAARSHTAKMIECRGYNAGKSGRRAEGATKVRAAPQVRPCFKQHHMALASLVRARASRRRRDARSSAHKPEPNDKIPTENRSHGRVWSSRRRRDTSPHRPVVSSLSGKRQLAHCHSQHVLKHRAEGAMRSPARVDITGHKHRMDVSGRRAEGATRVLLDMEDRVGKVWT